MRTDLSPRRDNALGEYLRARRAQLAPDRAGVSWVGHRRVPGLRREEVARLAGVSTDYYTRLEQGRERNPSPQLLHAVARALDLDGDAAEYLAGLAAPPPSRRRGACGAVAPVLRHLMEALSTPALVVGRTLDVLALNPSAAALYGGFARVDNLVRMTFLDPVSPTFHRDWEAAARAAVASLRAAAGHDRHDPPLVALVRELSLHSHDFRGLWARHDVHSKTGGTKSLHHPQVGDLELAYETLTLNSAPDQQLVVYQAAPASPSAGRLARLHAPNP
ncbi:helix-turn-helix domain-containing protein, partial [Streptomyces sp. NRRL B-24484]|uniref:helix-turn-helix domain-containing protein n=1 Tax=Streptomyces sp. NRRL B-24484 TaxID=1463833 RepID=UPI0004C11BA9